MSENEASGSEQGEWLRKLTRRGEVQKSVAERPGVLRTNADIYLHTHDAQRLVHGYNSGDQHVQGLIQFAACMNRVMAASRADDPFADLYISRVTDELDVCKSTLARLKLELDSVLTSIPGMNISVGESIRPVSIPIGFSNPFGYLGAITLRELDDVVRAARTALHVGLLGRDEAYGYITQGGRAVRRMLLTPFKYVNLGLSRTRLIKDADALAGAESRMGSLPMPMLSGDQRPRMAPRVDNTNTDADGGKDENTGE